MQIKVIKTIKAASCPLGTSLKEYKAGEICEIFNELAETFLKEGWGEKVGEKPEVKSLKPKLENKAVEKAEEDKSLESKEEPKTEKKKTTKKKTKK